MSREASFAARKLLERAAQHHVTPSQTCPLLPERGKFFHHERAKVRKARYRWDCLKCGKTFTTEPWLDTHLHAVHGALELEREGQQEGREWVRVGDAQAAASRTLTHGVCLADYCDILGCASYAPGYDLEEGGGGEGERARKGACEGVLKACFPDAQGTPFMQLQHQHLCLAPFQDKVQQLEREAEEEARFKWTPRKVLVALAVGVLFCFLLRRIILEDIRNPLMGVEERKKKDRAAAAATAAAAAAAAGSAGGGTKKTL